MTRMTLILLLGFSLMLSFSAEAGNKHRHHGKKHHKHHHYHDYSYGDRRHNCRHDRHYRDRRYARRYDAYYREPGIEFGYRYSPAETVIVLQSPNLHLGYRR